MSRRACAWLAALLVVGCNAVDLPAGFGPVDDGAPPGDGLGPAGDGGDAGAGPAKDGGSGRLDAALDAAGEAGAARGLLVGYYASWSTGTLPESAVDWTSLTHVAHAFALPKSGGGLSNADTFPDDALVTAAHANGVKVVVSVGGSSAPFADAVHTTSARAKTVSALASLCASHGYDGVDLDWEFPDATNIADWVSLVTELRTALDAVRPGLTISSTVDDSPGLADVYPLATLASLDWISAMTYAYTNSGSNVVGWYAPLREPADASTGSVVETIDHLVGRGVPASKLLLGLGFYGEEFRNGPPGSTIVSPADVVVLAQQDVANIESRGGWTAGWDSTAAEPSLAQGRDWISYEDARSIDEKCAYAKAKGLGGAMIWHLAYGVFPDGSQPLLAHAQWCR
jgi:chitinase